MREVLELLRESAAPGELEAGKGHRLLLRRLVDVQAALVWRTDVLDLDGRPCGTLLILDVPDRAAAEGFAAADPYAQANLFESTIIRGLRTVIRDGVVLGS